MMTEDDDEDSSDALKIGACDNIVRVVEANGWCPYPTSNFQFFPYDVQDYIVSWKEANTTNTEHAQ